MQATIIDYILMLMKNIKIYILNFLLDLQFAISFVSNLQMLDDQTGLNKIDFDLNIKILIS